MKKLHFKLRNNNNDSDGNSCIYFTVKAPVAISIKDNQPTFPVYNVLQQHYRTITIKSR